jgi:3-oxoacyl-[acyl-carrier protein] reductase
VNAIARALTAMARVRGSYDEAEWQRRTGQIPMERAAHPSEIAEEVAFLASDDAGYITRQTFV